MVPDQRESLADQAPLARLVQRAWLVLWGAWVLLDRKGKSANPAKRASADLTAATAAMALTADLVRTVFLAAKVLKALVVPRAHLVNEEMEPPFLVPRVSGAQLVTREASVLLVAMAFLAPEVLTVTKVSWEIEATVEIPAELALRESQETIPLASRVTLAGEEIRETQECKELRVHLDPKETRDCEASLALMALHWSLLVSPAIAAIAEISVTKARLDPLVPQETVAPRASVVPKVLPETTVPSVTLALQVTARRLHSAQSAKRVTRANVVPVVSPAKTPCQVLKVPVVSRASAASKVRKVTVVTRVALDHPVAMAPKVSGDPMAKDKLVLLALKVTKESLDLEVPPALKARLAPRVKLVEVIKARKVLAVNADPRDSLAMLDSVDLRVTTALMAIPAARVLLVLEVTRVRLAAA